MASKMAINFLLCVLLFQEFVIFSNQQRSFSDEGFVNKPTFFESREVRSLPNNESKNLPKRSTWTVTTVNATKLSRNRDEVQVGADVKVKCTGHSSSIVWLDTKNNTIRSLGKHVKTKFTKATNTSELKFSKVQMDQAGVYTCKDTKYGGVSYYTLLVYILPTVKLSPSKTVSLNEGEYSEIKCTGNSPNITWKDPHGSLVHAHHEGLSTVRALQNAHTNISTLTFTNATTWQQGVYVCSVRVSDRFTSESITVKVQPVKLIFSPDIKKTSVKENTDFEIDCEGNVKSLTWMFNGNDVSTSKRDDIYMKATVSSKNTKSRTLKLEDVQKRNEGRYVCSAISAFNGSKIERFFDLTIFEDDSLSKPKITLPEGKARVEKVPVLVNESLELNCKGETEQVEWLGPPRYWKIEGKPGEAAINVEKIKSKKVALRFTRITLDDAGVYKCRVRKRKIEEDSEVEITVVEPTFINDGQKEYIEEENGTITLVCSVRGYPKPTVKWYFNSDRHLISESSRFHYNNDDLQIKNITYKDSGKYICQAEQSTVPIGSKVERAVKLEVLHKPYFSDENITVEIFPTANSTIECQCDANPYPLEFSWYINDTTSPSNKLQFSGKQLPLNDSEPFGDYICAVSNKFGSNSQRIHVQLMMFPSIPELTVFQVEKESIKFKLKSQPNDTIILFNIAYKETSEEEWSAKNETKETWDYVYTLDDLQENTEYVMKARSLNARGFSNFSQENKFSTCSASFAMRFSVSRTLLLTVILLILFSCSSLAVLF